MTIDISKIQKDCCNNYNAEYRPVKKEQLVVISKGVYEGTAPIEGVRYTAPKHMSGWWLTTDEYNGDVNSLITVHYEHVAEKCPEVAIYMALPSGYRFTLGSESEHVWFDKEVLNENA